MLRYQPNNIIFRIASSSAISKFKKLQANSFMQVARKDLKFDTSAREVVLLEYDRFSQWIFRIERICMAASDGFMAKSLHKAIKESCFEEILAIETILESYSDIFVPMIVNYVKMVHTYSHDLLNTCLDSKLEQTVDKSFEDIVQIISDYLQHILLVLHELNDNCINKLDSPFLSISDFCLSSNSADLFLPIRMRAEFFESMGCGNSFLLKNYSLDKDPFLAIKKYLNKYNFTLYEDNEDAQKVSAKA
jgi:hypothetical protein